MTNEEKVKAVLATVQGVWEKMALEKSYLRHRFERWGPSTAKIFLECMESLGYTLIRKKAEDDYKLISAARMLQRRAQDIERAADSIDIEIEHGRSTKAMTLVEASNLKDVAEFLLEAAGEK